MKPIIPRLALCVITLIGITFSACSSTKPVEKSLDTFALDFRPYADQGFIITPYEYKQPYLGVGDISVIAKPGEFYLSDKQANERRAAGQDLIRIGPKGGFSWHVEPVSVDEAVAELVKLAKGMDADGIMALRIEFDIPGSEMQSELRSYLKRTIRISGFAFRKTR